MSIESVAGVEGAGVVTLSATPCASALGRDGVGGDINCSGDVFYFELGDEPGRQSASAGGPLVAHDEAPARGRHPRYKVGLIATNAFLNSRCNLSASRQGVTCLLHPLLAGSQVPVMVSWATEQSVPLLNASKPNDERPVWLRCAGDDSIHARERQDTDGRQAARRRRFTGRRPNRTSPPSIAMRPVTPVAAGRYNSEENAR